MYFFQKSIINFILPCESHTIYFLTSVTPTMDHITISDGYTSEKPKTWYCSWLHDGVRLYQKNWFYCSVCAIHKRVYYCHEITRSNSYMNKLSCENYHCMADPEFYWCVSLPFIHCFIWWTGFLIFFSSCFLDTILLHSSSMLFLDVLPCPIFCILDINYHISVRYILFNDYNHACERIFLSAWSYAKNTPLFALK